MTTFQLAGKLAGSSTESDPMLVPDSRPFDRVIGAREVRGPTGNREFSPSEQVLERGLRVGPADQPARSPLRIGNVTGHERTPRIALAALAPEPLRLERKGPREVLDSFLVRGPRRLELRRAA